MFSDCIPVAAVSGEESHFQVTLAGGFEAVHLLGCFFGVIQPLAAEMAVDWLDTSPPFRWPHSPFLCPFVRCCFIAPGSAPPQHRIGSTPSHVAVSGGRVRF